MLDFAQIAWMKRVGTIEISGFAMARLREEMALSQKDFGDQIGLSTTRVRHIEKKAVTSVYAKVIRSLSELTSKPIDEVKKLLAPDESATVQHVNVITDKKGFRSMNIIRELAGCSLEELRMVRAAINERIDGLESGSQKVEVSGSARTAASA